MRKHALALSYLLTIPVMGFIYTLLNTSSRQVHSLNTHMDQHIPFIQAFIVPYMLWMPFLYLTLVYFCMKDRNMYYCTLLAYNVGVLVSYGFYMFFQTTVPRPEISGEGLISQMTAFLYRADQPFNCFPSIHCMSSYLLFRALFTSSIKNKRNLTLIGSSAFIIILSTLFVKQHVVLDAVGGVILAEVLTRLVYRWSPKRIFDRSRLSSKLDA
jgi:membrane-associated phospholipid phosphatase